MKIIKHLGDITKIDGFTVPPVDCLIGGSPCQDLSVAGLRKGLEGERSGLFMEQIRLVKEMRENERRNGRSGIDVRPRFMVWENVPGAFSSNGGEDFRTVLEEVARVSEAGVVIPRPAKGKWGTSGVIIGDTYSIAYRVFDAQYWGVPQRRRRICLVADFNGHSAPDIVFDKQHRDAFGNPRESSCRSLGDVSRSEVQLECKSLQGHPRESREKGEGTASDAEGSTDAGGHKRGVYALQGNMIGRADGNGPQGDGINEDVSFTLNTLDRHAVAYTMQDREGKDGGGKGALIQEDRATSLRTNNYMTLFQPVPYCEGFDGQNSLLTGDKSCTILAQRPDYKNVPGVVYPMCVDMGGGKSSCFVTEDKSPTLCTTHYGEPAVAYQSCMWDGSQIAPTLTANNAGGSQRMPDKDNFNCVIQTLGCDLYNGEITGDKAKTITTNGASPTSTAPKVLQCFKANGDVGGPKAYSIVGDHENRITDMTSIIVRGGGGCH